MKHVRLSPTVQALVVVGLLMLVSRGTFAQAVVPPLTERVVDAADVLSDGTERTLVAYLKTLEDSTSTQIVVLTIPSLEGEAIEEFSLRAGREWGIGTGENDNGVLLVVAPNDREVRIEVGYGLEGALPDAVASRIIRNEIIPRFRDGDFDGGVTDGVYAVARAVEGEYFDPVEDDLESMAAVRVLLTSIFFFLASIGAFAALMMRGAGRWVVFAFLTPFFGTAGFFALMHWAGAVLTILLVFGAFLYLSKRPGLERLREKMAKAAAGEAAGVSGGWTFGSGSSSSWSSSGGGGFSGGGGSFGGGGASGSW